MSRTLNPLLKEEEMLLMLQMLQQVSKRSFIQLEKMVGTVSRSSEVPSVTEAGNLLAWSPACISWTVIGWGEGLLDLITPQIY